VGFVAVSLVVGDKGEMLDDPEVTLIGIPERNDRGESIEDIVYNAVVDTAENMPRARKRDLDSLAESARRAARAAVAQEWGKKPVCVVHVLQA
jgi:ribonuclease J